MLRKDYEKIKTILLGCCIKPSLPKFKFGLMVITLGFNLIKIIKKFYRNRINKHNDP
jgi:hypothetical protein